MIAMTPMPPTVRPTIESAIMSMRATLVKLLMAWTYTSCVTASKLFFCPGRKPRIVRIAIVTSSIARSVVTESCGTTNMSIQPGQYFKSFWKVPCGIMTSG